MNELLRNCLVAMGAEVSTADAERCPLHAVQADGDFINLPAVGAEWSVRIALDRLGSIVCSISKDKFVANPSLLLGLIELAAKFEVFLLKLRELDLPVGEINPEIGNHLNEVDVLRIFSNIVDTFQTGKQVVETGHNIFSCAFEVFKQSGEALQNNQPDQAEKLRELGIGLIMRFR